MNIIYPSSTLMMRVARGAAMVALVVSLTACSSGDTGRADAGSEAPAGDALTPEQLEKGIGPVTRVDLTDIDTKLVEEGEAAFRMKCTACHKMDTRYVGPPLGDVTERRAPEFVMNMMLNPEEMLRKHPDGKAMLAQYMTPMPDQQLTREEARSILEYLRAQAP